MDIYTHTFVHVCVHIYPILMYDMYIYDTDVCVYIIAVPLLNLVVFLEGILISLKWGRFVMAGL